MNLWRLVLSDHAGVATGLDRGRLNAPCGARCFLTDFPWDQYMDLVNSLNAPYGAWCFLTGRVRLLRRLRTICRLNAPYGASCFPTSRDRSSGFQINVSWCALWRSVLSDRTNSPVRSRPPRVLMHLLVLGAF